MLLRTMVVLAVLGLALSTRIAGAAVVFSDTEFANADWSALILQSSGPATFTAQQQPSGGNPGAYRELRQNFGGPAAGDSITTGHQRNVALYNPATQGAISEVDFAFDLLLLDGGASLAVAYGALLVQAGSYYVAGSELTTTSSWTSHVIASLEASDFGKIFGSGPSNPDFSSTGTPVFFGYYAGNGTAFGATSTLSGLDNWLVTVNQIENRVPEPATIALLALALVGLGFSRRKRAAN
jgi:PEP-CTERM motif-containing protein